MGAGVYPDWGSQGGYAPVCITPPSSLPVSLAEAKLHLRVDSSYEDDLIQIFLNAAVDYLDGYGGVLGKGIVTQTWQQTFDEFDYALRLPLVAASITSITYVNAAGSTVTLSSSLYVLRRDALGSYVEPVADTDWPATNGDPAAVVVQYVTGTAVADVPSGIRAIILLMVAGFYANREAATPLALTENSAVAMLIARHRKAPI